MNNRASIFDPPKNWSLKPRYIVTYSSHNVYFHKDWFCQHRQYMFPQCCSSSSSSFPSYGRNLPRPDRYYPPRRFQETRNGKRISDTAAGSLANRATARGKAYYGATWLLSIAYKRVEGHAWRLVPPRTAGGCRRGHAIYSGFPTWWFVSQGAYDRIW